MEHLYKSIEIKNYLLNNFPLPDIAVELVINNLKLAIDLNGYTNQMLLEYINRYCKQDIKPYLRKKYGKNRNCLEKLKKYQLIHIIQIFNVDIPLRPFRINYIDNIDINIEKEKTYIINTEFINLTFSKQTLCFNKYNDDIIFVKQKFRMQTHNRDYVYYSKNKKVINNILLIYNYFVKFDLDTEDITNFHYKFDKIHKRDAYSKLYYNAIDKLIPIDFNVDISRHLNNLKIPIKDLIDIVDKM